MALSTQASGLAIRRMARALRNGLMGRCTQASGRMIKPMEKANLCTLMEMSMKGLG